jgi:hypothetical protein
LLCLATGLAVLSYWHLRLDSAYVDESDVMASGWLIAKGRLMYGQIWSQHAPLEFMAAHLAALLFPAGEPWQFRLLAWAWIFASALSLAFSPLMPSRRQGLMASAWFLAFMALVTPAWYGHLITGNLLWGCAFAVALALWILPAAWGRPLTRPQAIAAGFALGLAAAGSPVAWPPLILALLLAAWSETGRPVLAWALAGLAAALFLEACWLSKFASWQAMWDQVWRFNHEIYGRWSGEGSSSWSLLSKAASDLYGVATESKPQERVLILAAPLAGALAFFASAERSLSKRLGLALLTALLLLSLRLRGQHWRALPFDAGCAALWALLFARRGLLGLGALLVLAVGLVRVGPAVLEHWDRDDFQQVRILGNYIQSRTKPEDKILALPNDSALYLAAKREPAQLGVNYYPWQADWEYGPGSQGRDGLCQQLERFKPRYILDERGAVIWVYAWKEHEPACVTEALKKDYRPVKGMKDLWVRKGPSS